MKARPALVALAFAALAVSAPAAAKPERAPAASEVDIRTLHVVAGCLANRYERNVRRLLAMDYRDAAYDDALRTLARMGSRCAPFVAGRLRSARVLVAGAFAEALLPATLNGSHLADRVAYDPSMPAVAARDEGEYLGLCSVRSMPDEVAGLLATRPASEEERLAIGNLRPRLGPCLRAGSSARINASGLRAIVALAAYRLVTQPAGPPRPGR